MLYLVVGVWGVLVVGLLHLEYEARITRAALRRAVRPASRCYIEGDTDAEIVDILLRGLAKERVG